MALDRNDKQYIEALLTKYRDFTPFSELVRENKSEQKKINQRVSEHLDNEEAAHERLEERIDKLNTFMAGVKGGWWVIGILAAIGTTMTGIAVSIYGLWNK